MKNKDNSRESDQTPVSGWQDSPILFKELRTRRGLTMREVEKEVGISTAYLSQLENEKIANPSFQTVI